MTSQQSVNANIYIYKYVGPTYCRA